MNKELAPQVTLNVNQLGLGSLIIGGIDFSRYASETIIHAKVGQPTTVTLTILQMNVTAECEDALVRADISVKAEGK